jgi:hypothetical protein
MEFITKRSDKSIKIANILPKKGKKRTGNEPKVRINKISISSLVKKFIEMQ